MSLPSAEAAQDCSAVGHTECGSALGLKLLSGDSSIEGDGLPLHPKWDAAACWARCPLG